MNTRMKILICVALVSIAGLMHNDVRAVLPPDFPGITVTTYDPAAVGDGYIFLAVASVTEGIGTYLMILDNNGDPVWYEKLDTHEIYDFKVNPNGYLSSAPFIHEHSYTGGGDAYHEIRDDSYNIVEEVHGKNGYVAEAHDFQILPNGNLLQFGYYMSEVDMSQIVEGGHPGALVSGGVVQELDAQRNVVFQWRTWDYYDFEDVTPFNRRPTGAVLSEFHLNTINQDPDGNIILGTPSEVRKINRQTSEVMWTLGGDNNEFTLTNPPAADISHFGGHATYRLENGNFLMYDNGSRTGDTSSIHEYTLDEVNKTATHVWSWAPATSVPAWHRGNAQRLPNGNTVIGWGGARSSYYIPAVTEVTPAGDVAFELYFDPNSPPIESYRAFRFPYPPATQAIEHEEIELATGDTVPFGDTGVTIKVNSGGGGYNECIVIREPYAPVEPVFFPSKAPRVLPVRINMTEFDIGFMEARIDFDNTSFGFDNPDDLTVYYRTTTGQGLFLPQPTANTGSALRITITLNSTAGGDFGEFIFCYADLADIAYPPILCKPESDRGVQEQMVIAPPKADPNTTYTVNQDLHILLSFSPKGLARYYFIQVATDENFTNLVENWEWLTECRKVWSDSNPGTTYYWRARIYNEAGYGNWSTGAFQTVPPMINAKRPINKELVTNGMDYLIQWEDNIAEDVIIDLYKGGVLAQTIATAPSDRTYEWEVLGLAGGKDYSIRITSSTNAALFDETDIFSIDIPDGDLDGDGKSDLADFALFAKSYLADLPTDGDYNGDAVVDISDLAVLVTTFLSHLN